MSRNDKNKIIIGDAISSNLPKAMTTTIVLTCTGLLPCVFLAYPIEKIQSRLGEIAIKHAFVIAYI